MEGLQTFQSHTQAVFKLEIAYSGFWEQVESQKLTRSRSCESAVWYANYAGLWVV